MHLFSQGTVSRGAQLAPTQKFQPGAGSRYAISFDDEPPQIVNVHADESLGAWEKSVARRSQDTEDHPLPSLAPAATCSRSGRSTRESCCRRSWCTPAARARAILARPRVPGARPRSRPLRGRPCAPFGGFRWWMIGLIMLGSIINYLTRSTLGVAAPVLAPGPAHHHAASIVGHGCLPGRDHAAADLRIRPRRRRAEGRVRDVRDRLVDRQHGARVCRGLRQTLAWLRGLLGPGRGFRQPGGHVKATAEWFPARERGLAGGALQSRKARPDRLARASARGVTILGYQLAGGVRRDAGLSSGLGHPGGCCSISRRSPSRAPSPEERALARCRAGTGARRRRSRLRPPVVAILRSAILGNR